MRNKNKGFTLIELLAAVVILGVLALFAIPRIINMVDDSRDKVYISDAKKLIAKADYKIRSASSDVEKPNPGECIIISMIYLDSDEFENPPNDGKYEKEASYVVVKNDNSQMEYSATIIEKTKSGTYRGVELSKESALSARNARSRVKTFKKEDLVYVEDANMTVEYLNRKLGNSYVTEIDSIYNTPDLADSSVQENSSSPKIMKASLSSTSGKSYNSLDATLTLRVDDADTPRNRLTVFTSFTSYDDALASTGENYGGNNTYIKLFDFRGSHSYNGETIQIFVVVRDDKENVAKKTLTYELHTNEPPEIDMSHSGLSMRDSDGFNNTIAKLRLSVSDDINTAEELNVCFAEGTGATCADSEFVSYASYFGDKDYKDYTFHCGGTCTLNGDTVSLNAFVRDLNGKQTSVTFDYTFYNNTPPEFEYVEGTNKIALDSVTSEYNNLSVGVRLSLRDDLTPLEQILVHLSDGSSTKTAYYVPNGTIPFTFSGGYDGEGRTLSVYLEDSMGATSDSETINYVVHEDVGPQIHSLVLTSNGSACYDENLCPVEMGGSNNVLVHLEAEDDITNVDDIMACISETSGVCVESNPSAFDKPYGRTFRNYEGQFSFTIPETHPYDGTNRVRTLYIGLMDSAGHITTTSETYQLYKNQAPRIESFTVIPNPDSSISEGTKETFIQLIAADDFGESTTVVLTITQDGVLKVTSNLAEYNGQNVEFLVDGDYDGTTKRIGITLTDSYGDSSEASEEYTMYTDQEPTVTGVNISSVGNACPNADLCPSTIGGTIDTTISIGVFDDVTPQEELLVCFSEDPANCDASHASNYSVISSSDYNYTFSYSGTFPYYNQTTLDRTLYVFVKDEKGNVGSEEFSYFLYKDRPPVLRSVTGWATNPRVTSRDPNGNGLAIHFDIDAIDDFDSDSDIKVRVCYLKGTSTTEACLNNYVTYNPDGYDFTLPGDLDGSIYHLYARVRDSRNNTTATEKVSSIVDYQVINDQAPVIDAFHVAKDESDNILVEFKVTDPLDTYKVCVGKTKCTTFVTQDINGETFSGSSGKTYVINYPNPSDLVYEGDPISLTLNVVDSKNHSVTRTTDYTDYTICSSSNSSNPSYEYTFDPNRTYTDPQGHTVTNNTKISAEKCSGRCYYWVKNNSASAPVNTNCPTSNIFGYYTKTTYYQDSLMLSQKCLHPETNPTLTTYQATCGYIDCFYNPTQDNYHYIAIGMVPRTCAEWTVTINGVDYTATTYYKSYTTSYNPGDSSVTLTEISRGAIHPAAIDAGLFNYDKNANVPYIRVLDN